MGKSIEINEPDMVPGATRDLATFSSSLSYEDIPAEVVSYVKELILDSLGVILFGNQTPWAKMVAKMAEESGATPRSTILGRCIKTSAPLAALANATGGHSFEYDEVHRDSATHPGSLIVPVVLALAQSEGHRTGRDFITAAVAAYEVGCRIGMTTGMGLFYRGHHPQGSVGVFFSATAASKILHLDAVKTQHALGIAGSHASGLMAAQEGAMVKRMHAGTAAQNGIYGAVLAQKGFTGIENVLEASFGGFINTFSESPRIDYLTAGLGTSWETLNIGYKPYSTVASIHSSLDGLLTMMRENQLKDDDIESLDIGCAKLTYHHCAWEYKPAGLTAAQMNLFYSLAMIAIDGDAGINQFTEDRLKDPQVLALISRITAHIDDEIEAKGRKHRYEVTLNLKTKDGRQFERREYHRRGTREYPPHPGDVEKKFRTLAGKLFDQDTIECLTSFIRNLEEKKSLEELFEMLAGKQ
jgi:2-methylcitrate dehydratase PrpD